MVVSYHLFDESAPDSSGADSYGAMSGAGILDAGHFL